MLLEISTPTPKFQMSPLIYMPKLNTDFVKIHKRFSSLLAFLVFIISSPSLIYLATDQVLIAAFSIGLVIKLTTVQDSNT